MSLAQYHHHRAQFVALALPPCAPTSTCYLNSNLGMAMSVEDMITGLSLRPEHFAPDELVRAKTLDRLWMWEEMPGAGAASHILAASSLPGLLGHLGDPDVQTPALMLFEQYFTGMSLCFNDFREAGWESAADFFKDHSDPGLFGQDVADRQAAIAADRVWTLVDQYESKTILAASCLPRLLELAWDTHPVLAKHRQLMELVEATPLARTPRSSKF